jgi:ATP-dependent helicase/nuclease subunit B
MALDFMTLSCGAEVYWTRSKMAGGGEAVQSRFLSRVAVMAEIESDAGILDLIRARDAVPFAPLETAAPQAEYKGDYYATWLESLVHNPYLFYARHILNLRRRPDVGDEIGAKEFGALVHKVIEQCAKDNITDEKKIIGLLENAANKSNILFRFWRNRFREMAPEIAKISSVPAELEKEIETQYAGRTVKARADRIENGVRVVDYKTGSTPTDAQLGLGKDGNCTMPQLPVEAMILKDRTGADVSMAFLSLKKNAVGIREYDSEETARAVAAVKKKLNVLFNNKEYGRPEYVEEKYRDFDDLSRAGD